MGLQVETSQVIRKEERVRMAVGGRRDLVAEQVCFSRCYSLKTFPTIPLAVAQPSCRTEVATKDADRLQKLGEG